MSKMVKINKLKVYQKHNQNLIKRKNNVIKGKKLNKVMKSIEIMFFKISLIRKI